MDGYKDEDGCLGDVRCVVCVCHRENVSAIALHSTVVTMVT